MNGAILEVAGISKRYKGGSEAVKNVTFNVNKGEFFAFLGPNGAGKSTTIKMLTTLMRPSSGEIRVCGFDTAKKKTEIRKKICVALQTNAIDPMLSGRELTMLQCRLFGMSHSQSHKRATEILETVDLINDADIACGKYSGGMQRRLDLALAMVHRPEILFLDEPTTGLDPVSRVQLWDEIRNLNKAFGTTIFLTTQYLEEADKMSDRVCILYDGTIASCGTPQELKRAVMFETIVLSFAQDRESEKAKCVLEESFFRTESNLNDLHVFIENKRTRDKLPEIIKLLSTNHIYPTNINITTPSLDDVFFQLTKSKKKSSAKGEKRHV